MPPINWRHQWDEAADAAERAATAIRDFGPSLTQQHHAKDADLNTIVKRYGITDGAIPPAALNPQFFGDFTDAVDFRDHMDRVRHATERFNALPADLRAMFNNDPVELHDWVMNPENAEEAVKLGLLVKQEKTPTNQQLRRNPETGREEAVPPTTSGTPRSATSGDGVT